MRDPKQGGFSLVEILIALAVVSILALVVAPNLSARLGGGKDRSYESDRQILQEAVNSFYADSLARPGRPRYPTGNGTGGSAGMDTYLNLTQMVSGNYLTRVPQSASAENPGGGGGSYTWYVDAKGLVDSVPRYVIGVYP